MMYDVYVSIAVSQKVLPFEFHLLKYADSRWLLIKKV